MWKQCFGCLCILLAIQYCGSDPEKMNFCDIAELIFNQKCAALFSEMTIDRRNGGEIIMKFTIWGNDLAEQVMISQFLGLLKPKNANEMECCIKEAARNRIRNILGFKGSFTARLFRVCELHVYSLEINTNKTTELTHLHAELSKVPNITELTWKMHNKCHPVNEIISNLKHLNKLELQINSNVDLDECDFRFNGASQLNILSITLNYNLYFESAKLRNTAFTFPTFLRGLNNLTKFELSCRPTDFEIVIPKDIFQGMSNIEELTLYGCFFNELSTEHFQDLRNLRVLMLMDATIGNYEWLRYVVSI